MGKPERRDAPADEPLIRQPLTDAQLIEHCKVLRAELNRRVMGLKTAAEVAAGPVLPPGDPEICRELFLVHEATQRAIINNNCQPL